MVLVVILLFWYYDTQNVSSLQLSRDLISRYHSNIIILCNPNNKPSYRSSNDSNYDKKLKYRSDAEGILVRLLGSCPD